MEIVYKSCSDYIVELEKLPDTITNETRGDVKEPLFAKFRGDKFLVKKIYHKQTGEEIETISNSVFTKKLIEYKVGEVIGVDDFDLDLDEVCSTGIHYFKTRECAYYYLSNFDGEQKEWYDNGQQKEISNYRNGLLFGEYRSWYPSGELQYFFQYKDGNLDGENKTWYKNGQCAQIIHYDNSQINGPYLTWFENGQQKEFAQYKDGKLFGEFRSWHENGQQKEFAQYKDGKLFGEFKSWYENGQQKEILHYSNGIKL